MLLWGGRIAFYDTFGNLLCEEIVLEGNCAMPVPYSAVAIVVSYNHYILRGDLEENN